MLYLNPLLQPVFAFYYNQTINQDLTNVDSWSKIITPERQLTEPTIKLINNSIYVIGLVYSFSIHEYYMYIAKYNTSGIKIWDLINQEISSIYYYVEFDSNENLYLIGNAFNYDYGSYPSLLKISPSGELIWSKLLDLYDFFETSGIQLGNNLTLYIKGYSQLNRKTILLKLNSSGNLLWIKEFNMDYGSTKIDGEGNIYLYGSNTPLSKYNKSGSLLWTINESVVELELYNDNIILAVYFDTLDTWHDLATWIMKLNTSGFVFEKTKICEIDFTTGQDLYIWFLNDIYVFFQTRSPLLLKYDINLSLHWNITMNLNFANIISVYVNLRLDSQQDIIFIYDAERNGSDIGVLTLNSSGQMTEMYFWGGPYDDTTSAFDIDLGDNLFIICQAEYYHVWTEPVTYTVLIKNPLPNGEPPPYLSYGFRDYYIFIFLGIVSAISIISLFLILKPKLKKNLKQRI